MNLVSNFKKFFRGDNYANILILLLAIWIIVSILMIYSTQFTKTITVKEKYIKPQGKNGSRYRIIDENGNNYELTDSIFLLEFDSADDYSKLQKGKTYKVYGYWFRFPILSWFPRIYKIE